MDRQDALYAKMTEFYSGDPARVQHFVKVHALAAYIGRQEALPEQTQVILEAAAIVHDIGIKPAEEKYGSSAGPLQEKEGPPLAEPMLESVGYAPEQVERICYLVSRHHTYTGVDGVDYRILLEADFLVNCLDDHMSQAAALAARTHFFRTATGTWLLNTMFALPKE